MRLPRWEDGRQGSGYRKLTLWSVWRTDAHLLRYPEGSAIPEHVDHVEGRDHYRLNVVLRRPRVGGEFRGDRVLLRLPRVVLFRPDSPHEVGRVEEGTRWVASIGWVR